MSKLSVVIPSIVETYLQKTVNDLLAKSQEEIEVIVVLDGYWPKNYNWSDPRIIIAHQHSKGMRAAINTGMAIARGEYVMKCDEHCMFDEGFDIKLKAACEDDWVVIPRRYRLDADKWEIIKDGRPPIDYMYLTDSGGALHGWKWDQKHYENLDVPIDDTMSFQGSCYFMKKKYWDKLINPLDDQNYGPFAQESQEIGNKAWLSGGRVVVNKNTWYAHWYRGRTGRGFTNQQQKEFTIAKSKGENFSLDFWRNNRWEKRIYDLEWLLKKFSPPRGLKIQDDE